MAAFAGVVVAAAILLPSIYYYGFNGQIGVPWDILRGPLTNGVIAWEHWIQPIVDSFNRVS